ncbi:MAG: MCE family protein [Tatlockia sp.]|nr:MCE family protein [Tatlockia sp.]
MEPKTNYTLVGLAVVILAGALIAAGLWLSVGFEQKKYSPYLVRMSEAVAGLTEQSPVKFNGVQVGYVSQIELNPQDPQKVEILLNIEEGTPITVSTYATLISQGITGNTYVGLSASTSNLTPLTAAPGVPYPVIPAKPSIFNQLDRVLKEVSENVNKVSLKMSQVFSEENIVNFNKSLANIKSFTHAIATNSKHINHSLKNADVLIKNMKDTSSQFPEVMTELKSGLVKFKEMASSIKVAGSKVSSTMESGKTAIEQISQQAVPPAIILIHRLDNIAKNLEKVSSQLRQNPSVLIRGSTPPQPGPGE